MIIYKVEFDKNEHDESDSCKSCGQEFDSYDKMYCIKNVWSGYPHILCYECLIKLRDALLDIKNIEEKYNL